MCKECGNLLLLRILIGSFIFLSLGTLFYVPTEAMLPAMQNVITNVFYFIAIIVALILMAFFSVVYGFPLRNALTSVNKELSHYSSRVRMVEALTFISSMILLIMEIPIFYQILLVSLILYAVHSIVIGYIVFQSGFISRFVGIFLMIGGMGGYLFGGLAGFISPDLIFFFTIGIGFAIISEVILAIALIITARRTTFDDDDSKSRVIRILKKLGEATTAEIVAEATKDANEYRDRAPRTLKAMELENEVTKRFSREKKGYVWSLVT